MLRPDTKYMEMALILAARAEERTYPNPMVGAVIVKSGKIIGKGYHQRSGGPHAEVEAIRSASCPLRGATMYVTLEPCDHHGKTPPCTDAIIKSGIKKVIIAMKDPNPLNSGRGSRKLKKAGIQVEVGTSSGEAARLNKKYIKFIKMGLPYVTVKLAQSLDGKVAARDGSSKWISSSTSRKYVKKIRSGFDAVMVGVNTVLADDPFLLDEKRIGYDTHRVVVDSKLRIPAASNILKTAKKSKVIIGTTASARKSKIKSLKKANNVDVVVSGKRSGKVSLKSFLKKLAKKGIVNIFVEGGGTLAGSLIDEGLVDEVMFFISPKILGGEYSSIKGKGVSNIAKALELRDMRVKKSGDDIFVRGVIEK
ncbi:MAG: bifunctional diaminohydroxyphosphoribosylaminopyrimidine deaminase/5-amino-6-(5-phosphoribosylamino)uracil reductase RibD [Candidatus Omnitrophica bacterium]|nr:bifunctional diaminohydroxyphosphoribosylaminopyrimidine deaminase/5-amino-6-(5-phosphoribosylamino)uracil reductase RibD [Candidatus Omnitrophota bacterium]